MKIRLNIHFNTIPGQHICITGSNKTLGNWNYDKHKKLDYIADGHWSIEFELSQNDKILEYKYLFLDAVGNYHIEWGNSRVIDISKFDTPFIELLDSWKAPSNEEKLLYSSAFKDAIMYGNTTLKPRISKAKKTLNFRINVPGIYKNQQLCILGNQKNLGNWDLKKPLLLKCGNDFPEWSISLNAEGFTFPMEYKYGIFDKIKKEVVSLEAGSNRYLDLNLNNLDEYAVIKTDESFKYPEGSWKGAGVAVPVFALRSDNSFGVGEFNDLFAFIDWAKSVDMKMIQILPVNETVASHNWLDSYPYKAVSVIALHPIYLNLEKMGQLKDKKAVKEFKEKQAEVNALEHVDYPLVHKTKSRYYKLLFDQEKETFFKSKEYKTFFKENKDWLVPYAAFVYLRDKMKNADFRKWTEFKKYNEKEIEKLSHPKSSEWDDIAVHYFIQYHLHQQLLEVAEYARKNGVVLKGDIPIGISPNSVEAWTEPKLFNLNAQAGAPPDDFAVKGQNWGFPTYNWEVMAKDNYSWWRKRLQKMATYFDAYRIDHILGFFRIWQIPTNAVEGLLGYFNPALPLSVEELSDFGLHFDENRFAKPYIRHHIIHNIFGDFSDKVIKEFLEHRTDGIYELKKNYDTQLKVNKYFLNGIEEEELSDEKRFIRDGLFELISNVIFVNSGENQWHPRISLNTTSSFADLDSYTKAKLMDVYNHFFFHRHNDFWYHKGMEKLPAIIEASEMLVCGEDLGMVPDCVPPAMSQLNILSLEIQRMSKNPKIKFAHPADAPYFSVCTSSTHDMSTIRGWWEEDRATIQLFYNQELGNEGEAPYFAEPWICRQIIEQHLYSPAMLTVFPIQDLLAIDGELRWDATHEEQINQPSNVRHKWRYRMKQSIEELQNAEDFNALLKELIEASGRS